MNAVLYGSKPGTAQDNPSNIFAFSICVLFLKHLFINLLINDIAAVLFATINTDNIIIAIPKKLLFFSLFKFLLAIFSNVSSGINPVNINKKIQNIITPNTPSIPVTMQLLEHSNSSILINPNNTAITIAAISHTSKTEIISFFFISNIAIIINVNIITKGDNE